MADAEATAEGCWVPGAGSSRAAVPPPTRRGRPTTVSCWRPPARLACRGYECKEPEPGKLTLAFRQLEDAVAWGCALQQELLGFSWPDTGGPGTGAGGAGAGRAHRPLP